MADLLTRWSELTHHVNGRSTVGTVGVRDPDHVCEAFDGLGYTGTGRCLSDGHYMCTECSHLAPDADRFSQHGRAGRADRLRLFWRQAIR